MVKLVYNYDYSFNAVKVNSQQIYDRTRLIH